MIGQESIGELDANIALLIVNSSDSIMLATDAGTYEIIFANERAKRVLGSDIIGKRYCDVMGSELVFTGMEFQREIYVDRLKAWLLESGKTVKWPDERQAIALFATDITGYKRRETELKRIAYLDTLLGIPNQLKFLADIRELTQEARERRNSGSLILVDIANYNSLRDVWGDAHAEVLLKDIADYLSKFAPNDRLYRYTEEKFIMLLPNSSARDSDDVLRKISERFAMAWDVLGSRNHVAASAGCARFPDEGSEPEHLIKQATAMLERARRGRNADMGDAKVTEIEAMLRKAVDSGFSEFSVYYQPIVCGDTGKWHSLEALIRWSNPQLGFVLPGRFLSVAESTGLIVPIGEWVIGEVARRLSVWRGMNHDIRVSINLSKRQIFRAGLKELILRELETYSLPANAIIAEVKEDAAAQDMETIASFLKELRESGIGTALDDFGEGPSSLNSLRLLPLDMIKINRSFTADVGHPGYRHSFIEMIVRLAASVGTSVCSIGVETEAQSISLMQLGSEYMQGFLFGRPSSADTITALLETHL